MATVVGTRGPIGGISTASDAPITVDGTAHVVETGNVVGFVVVGFVLVVVVGFVGVGFVGVVVVGFVGVVVVGFVGVVVVGFVAGGLVVDGGKVSDDTAATVVRATPGTGFGVEAAGEVSGASACSSMTGHCWPDDGSTTNRCGESAGPADLRASRRTEIVVGGAAADAPAVDTELVNTATTVAAPKAC